MNVRNSLRSLVLMPCQLRAVSHACMHTHIHAVIPRGPTRQKSRTPCAEIIEITVEIKKSGLFWNQKSYRLRLQMSAHVRIPARSRDSTGFPDLFPDLSYRLTTILPRAVAGLPAGQCSAVQYGAGPPERVYLCAHSAVRCGAADISIYGDSWQVLRSRPLSLGTSPPTSNLNGLWTEPWTERRATAIR